MGTDRDELPPSADVLVQLVLQVDERLVRPLCELDIAEDRASEVGTDLFSLVDSCEGQLHVGMPATVRTHLGLNGCREQGILSTSRVGKLVLRGLVQTEEDAESTGDTLDTKEVVTCSSPSAPTSLLIRNCDIPVGGDLDFELLQGDVHGEVSAER